MYFNVPDLFYDEEFSRNEIRCSNKNTQRLRFKCFRGRGF